MRKLIISRQQLYDMVWEESLSSIVKKYQLTYSELRKILADMVIPIPENGHWSKLKFGKQIEIKPLPEDYSGKNEVELIEKELNNGEIENKDINPSCKIQDNKSDELFKVPEKLSNPDILIVNTKEFYDAVRRYDWRSENSYPNRIDVLDIDATVSTFPRALRIMNTLIKILRQRDHDVIIKYEKTNVVIYEQKIEIKLREKYRVVDEPRGKYDSRNLEPTGILSFIIEPGSYYQKVTNDGQDLLETKLEPIIAKLEAEGTRKREQHIKNEVWRRQREEEERIENEIREKKEKEISDFKLIFQRAFRLHQTSILRVYILSVEDNATRNETLTVELEVWLAWAKKKVDWYDPMMNRMDETFNDNDKANIFSEFIKIWQ